MAYDVTQQPVYTSLLCSMKDAESFFAPTALAHTGFAADGLAYTAGVLTGAPAASWATEVTSATRGPLKTFPTETLVVVSHAALTLYDVTSNQMSLWMTFYLDDLFGYSSNPFGTITGYTPTSATWSNGYLSIVMAPDPGSASGPNVLTIDFVHDTIYADTRI